MTVLYRCYASTANLTECLECVKCTLLRIERRKELQVGYLNPPPVRELTGRPQQAAERKWCFPDRGGDYVSAAGRFVF